MKEANIFANTTLKKRCSMLLLSCLDWGYSRTYDNYEAKATKRLKLQHTSFLLRLRSCIDLIEDTENAILHFSTYGLSKFTSKIGEDYGEMYIKLYGILNAIYLQIRSTIELLDICHIHDNINIGKKLTSHKIYEMRNVMGAHTTDLEDKSPYMPENMKKNSFRIVQVSLSAKGDELYAVDSFSNSRYFDLYELVMDYNKLSEEILYNLSMEYINSLLPDESKHKTEIIQHYQLSKFSNYNYRKLYQNDKLRQSWIKRTQKHLKKINIFEEGIDLNEMINMTDDEIDNLLKVDV